MGLVFGLFAELSGLFESFAGLLEVFDLFEGLLFEGLLFWAYFGMLLGIFV